MSNVAVLVQQALAAGNPQGAGGIALSYPPGSIEREEALKALGSVNPVAVQLTND